MIYLKTCKYCNRKTPHRVKNISIMRGYRLQCLKCGTIQPKYTKINQLIEYHIEKEVEGDKNFKNRMENNEE